MVGVTHYTLNHNIFIFTTFDIYNKAYFKFNKHILVYFNYQISGKKCYKKYKPYYISLYFLLFTILYIFS